MQEGRKAKLRISSRAASFLQPEVPREEKLRAVRGEIPLTAPDQVALLLLLGRDPDREVKETSIRAMKSIDHDSLVAVCSKPDTDPLVLDALARFHFRNFAVSELIARHPNTDAETLAFLSEKGAEAAKPVSDQLEENGDEVEVRDTGAGSEEQRSRVKLSRELPVPEKIKLAMTGDKEWRTLLIRDSNKLVSESVLKNPRITEQEILHICNSTPQNDEILRIICTNREWTKNYSIRKALIENHRTPLQYALRFLSLLGEKDLAFMARNKNVSSIITTQARRMLINKNHGKK